MQRVSCSSNASFAVLCQGNLPISFLMLQCLMRISTASNQNKSKRGYVVERTHVEEKLQRRDSYFNAISTELRVRHLDMSPHVGFANSTMRVKDQEHPNLKSSRCEHGRRLSKCRKCAKVHHWCQHGKLKANCYACNHVKFRLQKQRSKLAVKAKCEHRIELRYCIDCGGQGICVHRRIRKFCPECFGFCWDGTLGCRHGLRLDYCAICGGNNLCPHFRIAFYCIDCGFRNRCRHGVPTSHQYRCVVCRGDGLLSTVCAHSSDRSRCLHCRKNPLMCRCGVPRAECTKGCPHPLLCEHNKMQFDCGSCRWCKHNVKLTACSECKLRSRNQKCEHGKQRRNCHERQCGGCHHGRLRRRCPICTQCPHGNRRRSCESCRVSKLEHRPKERCCHQKLKRHCEICAICCHRMQRSRCPVCQHKSFRLKCSHGKCRFSCQMCRVCKHGFRSFECGSCAPQR